MSRRDYVKYKEVARVLVWQKIKKHNELYGFKINRVAIKNHKSRWGSCSKKGNLNFNYKIALLPADMADYLIVHELCHLREFNHSARFWKLVSLAIPNWRVIKRKFKRVMV